MNDEPATLTTLPHELCCVIARFASPAATLALARCCKSQRAVMLADDVWRLHLEAVGFAPAGLALWRGAQGSLVDCFRDCKAAPIAARAARRPSPVEPPGWGACADVFLRIKVSNPFAHQTWTLFAPCSVGDPPAAWARDDDGRLALAEGASIL